MKKRSTLIGRNSKPSSTDKCGGDPLAGERGADTFIFETPHHGTDTIKDLIPGNDTLQNIQFGAEHQLSIFTFALLVFSAKSVQQTQASLPKGFFIDALMPPDRAEEALYNILGRYSHWVEKYGPTRARFIFATQSFGAIVSFWSDWLLTRARVLRYVQRS